MNKNKFTEYVKELLEPYGSVAVRAMFGGYGIYKDGVMIGIIKSNELYFKSDLSTYEYFQSFGSEPFVYQSKGKLVTLSYWKVLSEIMEDQELLGKWFKSLLGIFPAACGVIWRNEQIYTQKPQCYGTAVSHGISSKISPSGV